MVPSRLFAVVFLVQLACCTIGDIDGAAVGPAGEAEIEAQVVDVVANKLYRGSQFTLVNATPYPTELHDTNLINVFVSSWAEVPYRAIEPGRVGSRVAMDTDCIIVREVLAANEVVAVTVMAKGAPGYFSAGGDFYYAVLSPDGSRFEVDAGGQPLRGQVAACASCHADRADDGFLFGVPATVQHP